jgi:hypothetical protein
MLPDIAIRGGPNGVHKNAGLTPKGREAMVRAVVAGASHVTITPYEHTKVTW